MYRSDVHACAGMAADEAIAARVKRTGLGLITPATGLSALAMILSSTADPAAECCAVLAAVPFAWPTLLKPHPGHIIPSFFAEFQAGVAPQTVMNPAPSDRFRQRGKKQREGRALAPARAREDRPTLAATTAQVSRSTSL